MHDPNKTKSRFATISEAEILKIQERLYQKTQRRPQKVLLKALIY